MLQVATKSGSSTTQQEQDMVAEKATQREKEAFEFELQQALTMKTEELFKAREELNSVKQEVLGADLPQSL